MPSVIIGDDSSNALAGTTANDLIYGYNPNGPQAQVTSISANRVASGLTQPLFAVSPPGDTSRLFIVEKTGKIRILDLNSAELLSAPFLDLWGRSQRTASKVCSGSHSTRIILRMDLSM